ncbi:MAG TPA: hypothetical protein VLB00_08870 [Gemmatimonadales bacterium]|nr:hypothetical protein [Gemmatimonadales bacterium]
MSSVDPAVPEPPLPRELLLAFSPVHKSAFGIAIATVCALLVFGATALTILQPPESRVRLELLAVYFRGYSVSWAGALIGAGWAAVAGFVFGWFLAFSRNLVVAISLFVIRTRAQLAETRDFLDHI